MKKYVIENGSLFPQETLYSPKTYGTIKYITNSGKEIKDVTISSKFQYFQTNESTAYNFFSQYLIEMMVLNFFSTVG